MSAPRKRPIWTLVAFGAVAASAIVVAVVLTVRSREHGKGRYGTEARADEREKSGPAIPVKAVHPRNDTSLRVSVHPSQGILGGTLATVLAHKDAALRISVQQLLTVEPFFETALRSQVAGVVAKVPKSIGAQVKQGDLLVEIAVPDLDQEVLQKAAVIQQRLKDVDSAHAAVAIAEAQKVVSHELIQQRLAEASEAVETREYRKIRSDRFDQAVKEKGIQQNMADEERRSYRAAYFAVLAADSAVRKAYDDEKEKESMLQAARADEKLKEALVEVARRDYARAQALAGYARIVAPFDGQVVSRNVSEGSFVQNASTAQTEPLITLDRRDIVTVVMKVPDNYTPYVTRHTEAILQFDDLPGVEMKGRVTRFSRSIRNRDRTMRVEVDLWNDTPENYRKFAAKCVSTWLTPLAATGPLNLAPLLTASDGVWSKNSKDRSDPFPVLPIVTGNTNSPVKLIQAANPLSEDSDGPDGSDKPVMILPGASGFMRLNLRHFEGAYLLPSSAVFSRGGKMYILEVRDGKSHMLTVRVQVNDGRWAKVAVIEQEADPMRGKHEKLGKFTGDETIILNRQVEIGDGQPVEVSFDEP